jgi:hypothetical protein
MASAWDVPKIEQTLDTASDKQLAGSALELAETCHQALFLLTPTTLHLLTGLHATVEAEQRKRITQACKED